MMNYYSPFIYRKVVHSIVRTKTYIKVRGINVLRTPSINKDTAFTIKERHLLGIHGLLPPAVDTLGEQSIRTMICLKKSGDDLNKHLFLVSLMERNEVLFYKVISDNIEYCMPLIYTPTVGLACQKYGLMFRRSRGLYITIHDKMYIKQILDNWPSEIIKAIVVTDGERILGLGDLGAYGMGIPIGKLSLYTALAGVPPKYTLPVLLDVGTNNQELLDDPMYLGLRHKRIGGSVYDEFFDAFMEAVQEKYGEHTLIQFEDLGSNNAYRILNKYKDKYCAFNDDIQGTAAVCLSALLGAEKISKRKLQDNIILFQGAGSAATGIAKLIKKSLIYRGDTEEIANSRIFMFDIDGLLTKCRKKSTFTNENLPFAKDISHTKSLEEAVKQIKPTVLIGVAGVGHVFTKAILEMMKENVETPYIFALSNPTSKAECTAEDAYSYTEGKCVFASGSPFNPVDMKQKTYFPTQCNNSYIFPGIALAIILFRIRPITSDMFVIAAETLASLVSEEEIQLGRIFPSLESIRNVSISIATAVANYAYKVNLSHRLPEPPSIEEFIKKHMFSPKYRLSFPDLYQYPK